MFLLMNKKSQQNFIRALGILFFMLGGQVAQAETETRPLPIAPQSFDGFNGQVQHPFAPSRHEALRPSQPEQQVVQKRKQPPSQRSLRQPASAQHVSSR